MVRTYLLSGTGSWKHRNIVISTLLVTVTQTGAGNTCSVPNPGKGIPTVTIRSRQRPGWGHPLLPEQPERQERCRARAVRLKVDA